MKTRIAIFLFLLFSLSAKAQLNHFYAWTQFVDSTIVLEWQHNGPPTQILYYPVTIEDYRQVHISAESLFLDSVPSVTGTPNNYLWRASDGEVRKSTLPPALDEAGDVELVAYTTPPSGWLACNGSAVSRTTYASLFSKIGITHGSGDGSTTFNLPNLSPPSGCAYIIKY